MSNITVTLPKEEYDRLVEFEMRVKNGEIVLTNTKIIGVLNQIYHDYAQVKKEFEFINTESLNQEIVKYNNLLAMNLEEKERLYEDLTVRYNQMYEKSLENCIKPKTNKNKWWVNLFK